MAEVLEIAKYIPNKIITKLTPVNKLRFSEKNAQPSTALRTGTTNATKLANPEDNFLRE
jgi:hypothetical protein